MYFSKLQSPDQLPRLKQKIYAPQGGAFYSEECSRGLGNFKSWQRWKSMSPLFPEVGGVGVTIDCCISDTWMSIFSYFPSQTTEVRPKSANNKHPRHFCMGVLLGKQITICSTWFFVGSASLSSDFDGWQLSRCEVILSWHSGTFISWEKLRELSHFIVLLSLM